MYTKESLLSIIERHIERRQDDYLRNWLPSLRNFSVIQLVAWVIDHDIMDAGSFYQ